MQAPPPRPLMPLHEYNMHAVLIRGGDQPRDIGWCGGSGSVGRVDVVRR